jgi:hypothetical protein
MAHNPKLFETRWATDGAREHVSDITLLDLFAGMAMQGLLAGWPDDDDPKDYPNKITEDSYELARMMLEEREKYLKGESDAEKTS